MRIPFRQRIFLGLVALGTVPLAVALLVLALEVFSTGSSVGPRAALDRVTESGRTFIGTLDTTTLDDSTRAALRQHTETIARGTSLARRAERLSRYAALGLGALILVVGVLLGALSVQLARRWSAYFSAPIDELINWVGLIRRRESLPPPDDEAHSPEFDALRNALREMSDALDRAREQEIEQERLVAFREVARQVAHEVRGPLTASRLALAQLSKSGPQGSGGRESEIAVLAEELQRLENLAREFADFGRLPEGPEADVDIDELLDSVVQATVPDTVPVRRETASGLVTLGHYEPLRRAVQNLLRNAVEATDARGVQVLTERCDTPEPAGVRICIADHGAGVPAELRTRIFEPYFTTKELGTGLGLAMVKQTVHAHEGTITVQETDGGGATFIIQLPDKS